MCSHKCAHKNGDEKNSSQCGNFDEFFTYKGPTLDQCLDLTAGLIFIKIRKAVLSGQILVVFRYLDEPQVS